MKLTIIIPYTLAQLQEAFREHFNGHVPPKKRRKIKVTKKEIEGWVGNLAHSDIESIIG